MAYTIESDGVYVDGVRVNVAFDRNDLFFMVRLPSPEYLLPAMRSVGLIIPVVPAKDAVIDEITGEELEPARPASEEERYIEGLIVVQLGPYMLSPPTFDSDGNLLTSAIVDTRHHVNIWVPAQHVSKGAWEQPALMWTQNGSLAQSNSGEVAVSYNGVELIDPYTIQTPYNVRA